MAASAAFEAVQSELERFANMDRWNARGAIQLALMDAGLEASNVTSAQMKVVVERLLPKQLQSQKIADVPNVCERIRGALALLGDDSRADSPDKVFQRLGS
ncbi:MAG TPA: hypothetical protein VMR86_08975 [Myxococcota bacterium]|nr:hypothetical protein [Myxococcota bacterium]